MSITRLPSLTASQDVQALISTFLHVLESEGAYTEAEISAGMLTDLFVSAADLPAVPPTGVGSPSFAAISDDGGVPGAQLAYWDFTAVTPAWVITDFPWRNPVLIPQSVIEQDSSVGAGANNWQFAMGPIIQIVTPCRLRDLTVKVSSNGNDHAWALRLSTQTGAALPPLATFTNIIAQGTVNVPNGNIWTSVGANFGGPYNALPGQWYLPQVWPGPADGQSFTIATERAAGNLNESLGVIAAGTFVSQPGGYPGSVAVPTNQSATTVFGICSVELGP